jgi:hypothetical protein
MDIEINFLRHAVALGDYLHFGKAAKSLRLSQPALSRSIGNLESKLGQDLFIRKNKTIIATDFGRLLLNEPRCCSQKSMTSRQKWSNKAMKNSVDWL